MKDLRAKIEAIHLESVDVALSQGQENFQTDLVNLKANVDNLIFEIFAAAEHDLTEEEVLGLMEYQTKLKNKKEELC